MLRKNISVGENYLKEGILKEVMDKQKYYRCASCGFAYAEKKIAQQCEAWCKKHHSCSLEITRKAVKV